MKILFGSLFRRFLRKNEENEAKQVLIKKLKPEFVTYVDYYCTTYSKKLTKKVDIKKITEEQYERNLLH